MRVTNNMLVSNMIRNLNSNLRRMDVYQAQLSTGKAIQSASDDPVLASKILKYRTDISELGQFSRNVEDAQSWMEITESAVADVGKVLQKVRELMVQGANTTNGKDELLKIADEVKQMKKQIIMDGNATFAGRYVFSSYETNTKLFNDDGTYNIDITQSKMDNRPVSKFQVSVGEEMNTNTNGLELFGVVPETSYLQTFMGDSTTTGTAAAKSQIKGSFPLTADYTAGVLDITLGGATYTVDTTGMDGTTVPIDKATVLNQLKNATDGGTTLDSIADVYFDSLDQLVIKSKNPDNTAPGSTGWLPAPTLTTGAVLSVPPVTASSASVLTDTDVSSNREELSKPFYMTVNGQSRMIQINAAGLTDVAGPGGYVAALQASVDNAFGLGKVTVGGASGAPVTFSLNTSPADGTVPTIQIENVVATKSTLIEDLDKIIEALEMGSNETVGSYLDSIDTHMGNILTVQSDIGARTNRLELIMNRLEENNISFTKLLSSAEDADMSEVIMNLKNAENVYRASLSTGAKVIQPTLTDFLG